jgi:dCMP deaminase
MYFHCENPKDGTVIESFPCFFCKRIIINAGIERFIGASKEGGYKIYNISDWKKEWQEKDIVDDKHQFGTDLNIKDGYKNEN